MVDRKKDVIRILAGQSGTAEEYSAKFDEMVEEGLLQGKPDIYGEIHYSITEKGLKLMKELGEK